MTCSLGSGVARLGRSFLFGFASPGMKLLLSRVRRGDWSSPWLRWVVSAVDPLAGVAGGVGIIGSVEEVECGTVVVFDTELISVPENGI